MKKSVLIPFFVVTGWYSATTLAQNIELDLEPGLWQHSFKVSSQSGRLEQMMQEVQQQLAALPEAQRQMMLDMLKAQGMSFDGMSGSVEVCMTAEDLKQGKLPEQEGCKQQLTQQDKNRFSFTFQCSSEPPSSGSGEMLIIDRKTYQGSASFSNDFEGQQEQMQMSQQGRWLRSNCS